MGLILILFLTTLAIAGSAAYFSVLGLAAMFSAAYWPVVIMGGSLELGKLVAASFVYRTWKSTGVLMKTYLIMSILLLMIITSLGIFGFLSKGYGDSTQMLQQVEYTTAAKQLEVDQVDERLEQVNRIIEAVPNNYVSKRIELQREYATELDELATKRNVLRTEMTELRSQKQEADAHVGPILYVAAMFGVSTQDAVLFFILALIAVFDPMAVVLTLATNHAIEQRQLRRSQTLAEKRQHELAVLHEAAHNTTPDPAGEACAAFETEPLQPMGTEAVENLPKASSDKAEDTAARPLITNVPTRVAGQAIRREPSVAELNAVLRKADAGAESLRKARTETAPPPLALAPASLDSGYIEIAGVTIPVAILWTLGESDQKLLQGLSRGLSSQVLSATLSMTEVNLRKRALHLAERLTASGYPVNPKLMFN